MPQSLVLVQKLHSGVVLDAGVDVLPGGTGSPEGPGGSRSLCPTNLSPAGQDGAASMCAVLCA